MPRLTKSPSFDNILDERTSQESNERLSLESLNTLRPNDDLYVSEKQKLFKSKGKHNLASLGAKISSTAASVGAHTSKLKKIDTSDTSDTMSLSSGITLNSPGLQSNQQPLKNKMFKQSRSDLKSLKLKTDLGFQAARTSLERSPMTRGGTVKELDRIASIGLPISPTQISDSTNSNHLHLHHPHLSFRKRDSPAAILSSSASNSTLASEGTLYSFNISNTSMPNLQNMQSFKTVEEGQSFLTSSWSLLKLRIEPVFKRDEVMRIPVEDVNILFVLHFLAHYSLGGSGPDLLKKLDQLLTSGMRSLTDYSGQTPVTDLVKSWDRFHNEVFITLQAGFLPLQLEFDGHGQVFNDSTRALEYFKPLEASKQKKSKVFAKQHLNLLTVKRRILLSFRNTVLVPHLQSLDDHLQYSENRERIQKKYIHVLPLLLQCFSTMLQLKLKDQSEEKIQQLLVVIRDLL